VVDGDTHCDRPAQRITHDIGLLISERFDEFGNIGGHGFEAHGSTQRSGAAMRLQVDANDLAVLRKRLDVGTEHLDRSEAAVEEDQRIAITIGLIPDLDVVDLGEAGFCGSWELGHLRNLLCMC